MQAWETTHLWYFLYLRLFLWKCWKISRKLTISVSESLSVVYIFHKILQGFSSQFLQKATFSALQQKLTVINHVDSFTDHGDILLNILQHNTIISPCSDTCSHFRFCFDVLIFLITHPTLSFKETSVNKCI